MRHPQYTEMWTKHTQNPDFYFEYHVSPSDALVRPLKVVYKNMVF